MRFFLRTGVAALACAAVVAGCGGGDEESTDTETTPSNILTAVFERAFSECGTQTVEQLSGKYRVAANSAAVSTAVGKEWAARYGGHADAEREGKLACLQSFALERLPGDTRKKSTTTQSTPTVTVSP